MYSKLVSWEVWNFMSVTHGKCEFDEKGIINLKGYNDSGKSAMLQALKVLISNSNPTKQVAFIQDEKGYFRIFATFDDGVQILRDKYSNGQSLYEMYKGGELLFSTKSGNALTKVSEVPEPIAEYLGLVMWDGVCLNARTCFDKQFGVQTTGSETYKAFNTVLKSEEIARAGELLNADKNKLAGDISAIDSELQAQKTLLGRGSKITDAIVTSLTEEDMKLDQLILMEAEGSKASGILQGMSNIVISPAVSEVSTEDLELLCTISGIVTQIDGIAITPELREVAGLEEILEIKRLVDMLGEVDVPPELHEIDGVEELQGVLTIIDEMNQVSARVSEIESELTGMNAELDNLVEELKAHNVNVVKCPNCGEVFSTDSGHAHMG